MFRIIVLFSAIYLLNKGYNYYRIQNNIEKELLEHVKTLRSIQFSEELIYRMTKGYNKNALIKYQDRDYPAQLIKRFYSESGVDSSRVKFNACYGYEDQTMKHYLTYCPVGKLPFTFAIMDEEVVHTISY